MSINLSEPGLLYAREYALLEEARLDLHCFLDAIKSEVDKAVRSYVETLILPANDLLGLETGTNTWWTVIAKFLLSESYCGNALPRKKGLVEVGFGDVRVKNPPNDPLSVWLRVEVAKPVENSLKSLSGIEFQELMQSFPRDWLMAEQSGRCLWYRELPLDPESVSRSAEIVIRGLEPLLTGAASLLTRLAAR